MLSTFPPGPASGVTVGSTYPKRFSSKCSPPVHSSGRQRLRARQKETLRGRTGRRDQDRVALRPSPLLGVLVNGVHEALPLVLRDPARGSGPSASRRRATARVRDSSIAGKSTRRVVQQSASVRCPMIVPANPTRCSPDPTRLRFAKPSEAASARNAGPWVATSRGDLRSQRQGRPSESLDGAQHQISTLRGLGRRPARPTEQRVRSGLSTGSRESSANDAIMVYKRGN